MKKTLRVTLITLVVMLIGGFSPSFSETKMERTESEIAKKISEYCSQFKEENVTIGLALYNSAGKKIVPETFIECRPKKNVVLMLSFEKGEFVGSITAWKEVEGTGEGTMTVIIYHDGKETSKKIIK